ncbi:MAG: hypothetical protein ACJ76N_07870 [Thermoanaerobaculia bacterium]
MKTDRLSVTRAAALLLAGLLLATGHAATGGPFRIGLGRVKITYESRTKQLAQALTLEVKGVQTRFDDNRRALRALKGSDGKPAYLRKDVADLIDHTGKDLDTAIVKVQPSDLQPLRDWVADELGRIQGELPPAPKNASLFAPQPVAVIASLGSPPKKKKTPASPKPAPPAIPAAPPPDTVPTEKTAGLLDEVGKVVSRIFTLASTDNLTMKLWVGSTVPHATFSFWPQGKLKGSTPAPPNIIRTDGKKGDVLRGLYVYKATYSKGPVTEFIEYPPPASAQVTPSERLDLVNGTGFFCCRFDEHYCHAVATEKECRH